MKTRFLFPHRCKIIGLCILLTGILVGFVINNFLNDYLIVDLSWLLGTSGFNKGKVDMTFTLTCSLLIIGGVIFAFSKEKVEDEYIADIRLTSLLWAVFINYLLLLIAVFVVYDLDFLDVLIYNMFTPLIIFVIRFNFLLYKSSKKKSDEK
ncbi:hypothetical protein [uncultured Dysgonomonas sp.]|uniref:Uncharacterized protein n=1 Tax=uncultured Dysgonomonas sp. TaxID=206096 RepID=A0A212J276_9BACT|nr:hypothetical protein [uncultured Dysgonomonas sp.]SBV93285.1 conserved membrane hypothetical protein [uncultured Dysgonomonas sp.]